MSKQYKTIKIPLKVYEYVKAEATRRGCFIGHLITEALYDNWKPRRKPGRPERKEAGNGK